MLIFFEWNTYSYLDTEVLLKYNEISKEKTSEKIQMILNYKKAIEYRIYYKKELDFNKQTFLEIHSFYEISYFLKKKYIIIILAIYEFNNTSLIEVLWTQNYLLNLERYKNYFN